MLFCRVIWTNAHCGRYLWVPHLDAEALLAMAMDREPTAALENGGDGVLNSPFPVPGYPEMTVNSYLFWSLDTRKAAFSSLIRAQILMLC